MFKSTVEGAEGAHFCADDFFKVETAVWENPLTP
jgi:hypothetical protein